MIVLPEYLTRFNTMSDAEQQEHAVEIAEAIERYKRETGGLYGNERKNHSRQIQEARR